jgi:glycosyltransferase involved in cell wall biosynthesis
MKLVMTLLVRDEADIIDDHIAFHLAVGVDFIIAADNGSTDGTTEILERYARDGHLYRFSLADPFSQIDVVTRMARLAGTRFGADWVINSDADEFWWPRSGTLKELLGAVPPRFGSVRGMWRNFVARPEIAGSFSERMTIRSQKPTPGVHPFNPHFKTVHRAAPDVEVGGGNHDVSGSGLTPLFGWYPVDVLHFPIRSLEQFERKFVRWWEITAVDGEASNPYYNVVRDAHREGRMAELYDPFVVDDEQLASGLADGTLVEDTRLRDALRSLRRDGGPHMDVAEPEVDRGYLVELAYIEDNSPFVRAQRRIEALEARASRLENTVARRISRRLARRTRLRG